MDKAPKIPEIMYLLVNNIETGLGTNIPTVKMSLYAQKNVDMYYPVPLPTINLLNGKLEVSTVSNNNIKNHEYKQVLSVFSIYVKPQNISDTIYNAETNETKTSFWTHDGIINDAICHNIKNNYVFFATE